MAVISPKKVDLVVDTVGGKLLPQVVVLLGQDGLISVVGRSGGAVPKFNSTTLLFHRIRMGGVSVGDYTAQAARAAWKEISNRLNTMWQRPTIVTFEDIKMGFMPLAQGPMGKIIVRVKN